MAEPLDVEALLDRGLEAIDAANADDPATTEVDGEQRSKELDHAERMTRWVAALDPEASPAQLLAARAAHLRRWVSPRTDYPDGRAGYLTWRSDQKKRQAAEVQALLEGVGYDSETADRVGVIVAKEHRSRDPQVQTHEDALCLTFLETGFDDLADRLGDEHTVTVLQRTIAKMSPVGLEAAGSIDLSDQGAALLGRALAT